MGRVIVKSILTAILVFAVLLGCYLAFSRYIVEQSNRKIMLAVDLNDVKKIAAYEKKPLAGILSEMKKSGVFGIGVFEETLPDAAAMGEVYYSKGSGIIRLSGRVPVFNELLEKGRIKADKTYLYIPDDSVRKRIFGQIRAVVGEKGIKFLGKNALEVDEAEEELRALGLGISENQQKFLSSLGFSIIPRIWNDPRYHIGNIETKVAGVAGYELIVFDGDEILGYPDSLPVLSGAMKKYNLKYGFVEIVKQDGDASLKKMMGQAAVRVHSVPKDELKKINKPRAIERFVRAARERSVRVIYIRPFLPPQIDAFPVGYNLKYISEIKESFEKAGFVAGQFENTREIKTSSSIRIILGCGVVVGMIFLLDSFFAMPLWIVLALFVGGAGLLGLGEINGHALLSQKILSFLAAVVFPSYAVISAFAPPPGHKSFALNFSALFIVIKILAVAAMGIILMIGLLADSAFINGNEVFPAVKLALVLPMLIIAAYFFVKSGTGSVSERMRKILQSQISVASVMLGVVFLGGIYILISRSGNFSLPVPGFEKNLRSWLEIILFVRPRTKEFLIGYPFLVIGALYYLRGQRAWLWLLAVMGSIAPISVFNTFSHIHTPLAISLIRALNGLIIGVMIGMLAGLISRFIKVKIE